MRQPLGKAESRQKLKSRKLCHLASPLLSDARRNLIAACLRRRKIQHPQCNRRAHARLFSSSYDVWLASAEPRRRQREARSSDTALPPITRTPSIKSASWTKTLAGTKTVSGAYAYARRYKVHPGKSVLSIQRAPIAGRTKQTWRQMAAPGSPTGLGRLNLLSKSYDGLRQFLNVAG